MRGFIDRDEQERPRRRTILWVGIIVATPIAMFLLFGLVFVGFHVGFLCISPPLAWAIGAFIAGYLALTIASQYGVPGMMIAAFIGSPFLLYLVRFRKWRRG